MLRAGSSTICCFDRPPSKRDERSVRAALVVLSLAAAQPAWAQTNPNPPPTPPPSVVTSIPALSTVGAGGCKQQYTGAINGASQNALIAMDSAVASAGVGAAAALTNAIAQNIASGTSTGAFTALGVGLAGTVAYGTSPLPNFEGIPFSVDAAAAAGLLAASSGAKTAAWLAAITGASAAVAGVASQTTAQVFRHEAQNLTDYIATLPNCESTFTGTLTVAVPAGQGALNASGDSFFSGNVGVTQNVDVGGNVTASKLLAPRVFRPLVAISSLETRI
jgi:hypothetical protein